MKIFFTQPLLYITMLFSAGVILAGCAADDYDMVEDHSPPYLDVEGDRTILFEEEGGKVEIRVLSETYWNAIIDSDWCHITFDTEYIYLSVPLNYDTSLRKAKIAVTSGNDRNTSIVVLSVIQSGAGEAYAEFVPCEIPEFEAAGGEFLLEISTNQSHWEVVKNEPESSGWFSIEHTETDNILKIVSKPNEGYNSRSSTITVNAGVKDNTASDTITVIQAAAVPPDAPVNLSVDGTANCYIVGSAGVYSIAANIIGNGNAGIVSEDFHTTDTSIAPVRGGLVWTDTKGSILSAVLSEGGDTVIFEVADPFVGGNAVMGVYDDEDNLLWSWHIWMPNTPIAELGVRTGYTIMNVNLGALNNTRGSVDSFGLLYQWGRKDPLPGTPVIRGTTSTVPNTLYDIDGNELTVSNSDWYGNESNTIFFAIRNPLVCLSNMSQYAQTQDWLAVGTSVDALWGNPSGYRIPEREPEKGSKSIYDPCPTGWRVPPTDIFQYVTPDGNISWNVEDFYVVDLDGDGALTADDFDSGWEIWLDEEKTVSSYFPAAARYDGSYAMLMGSVSGVWGSYWGNSPYPDTESLTGGACSILNFQIEDIQGLQDITMSSYAGGGRANAFSIRCVKDEAIF